MQLSQHLFEEDSTIMQLFVRNINQDSLENTFGWFRNNSGCNVHPDLMQFGYLLGKLLSHTILNYGTGTNCVDDHEEILELDIDDIEEEPKKNQIQIGTKYKTISCDSGTVR